MSNLQPKCCLKVDFQKMDKHAGGKWLIHDTKTPQESLLSGHANFLRLIVPFGIWQTDKQGRIENHYARVMCNITILLKISRHMLSIHLFPEHWNMSNHSLSKIVYRINVSFYTRCNMIAMVSSVYIPKNPCMTLLCKGLIHRFNGFLNILMHYLVVSMITPFYQSTMYSVL